MCVFVYICMYVYCMYVYMYVCVCVQYLSTSPEQESAHFEAHCRQAMAIIRDHPQPHRTLFTNNQPRIYTKEVSGAWSKI